MADVTPNYRLEQQRLRSQIAAQRANIERQRLDILEMADRLQRHEANIAASEQAIAEMERQLLQLEETHGLLTEARFEDLKSSLIPDEGDDDGR